MKELTGKSWPIRIGLAVLFATILTACTALGKPDAAVLKKAIALQLNQVQTELSQQLFRKAPSAPAITVNQVHIQQQQLLRIDNQPGYHVEGTFDATFDFPDRSLTQRHSRFDLYLQQQPSEKTWQLARPLQRGGEEGDRWLLHPIP